MDISTLTNTAGATRQLAGSWISRADLRLISERVGTPVFIYSEQQLVNNVKRIKDAAASAGIGDRVELYVPFFPNSNPHVLKPLQDAGVGLLLQLPSEHKIVTRFGFKKFIVSPGHVSDDEIKFWARTGYPTFLSSLNEVLYSLNAGAASISVRVDSLDSEKPGIKYSELASLADLLREHKRDLECFEVYCGSGKSLDDMINIVEQVFTIYKKHFPTAKSINFAGGHGFDYEKLDESEKHFAWDKYFDALRKIAERLEIPSDVKLLFEPARDVLADVGALLLSVKRNVLANAVSNIVATDGSRMLMPSAQLRSRRHNVAFLDERLEEITSDTGVHAALRGRSILRNDYILPGYYWVPEGVGAHSYALILDVGAYCATQHMEFLNIPPAAEVLIATDGSSHLVTSRGDDLDKWRNLLAEKQDLSNAGSNIAV